MSNTINKTLNIQVSFDINMTVKNGEVSWEKVYEKVMELEKLLPEGVYILDSGDYYLGREDLEMSLKEEDNVELVD